MKLLRIIRRGFKATLLLLAFGLFFVATPVFAVSNGISQGYTTNDQTLVAGMVVALSSDDQSSREVEAVNSQNIRRFVGVVTTINDNLVSLTNDATDVLVTTNGEAQAFISDVNGQVAKGDLVTISPLNGVLMKASEGTAQASSVGVALEPFDDSQAETQTVTDAQNAERVVRVEKVNIEINKNIATGNPAEEATSFLLAAGESITGRPVGQVQVFAAILVLLIILIVEGSIIYGAVHSTITALGRNPLAKRVVFKQILQVSWLAMVVLVFGLGAIYIILWI